jgi:repressor LexA
MANNRELGKKQKEIYECIKRWLLTKGYPPTVREICTEVDLKSTASVYFHLNSLEMKGYIRRDPDKPRTIEVLDDEFRDLWISSLGTRNAPKKDSSGSSHSSHAPSVGSEVVQVPIVGRVAAGTPLLAVEQVDSYFPVPVDRLPKEQCFILKVRGDSMVNAGIFQRGLCACREDERGFKRGYSSCSDRGFRDRKNLLPGSGLHPPSAGK